MTGQNNEREKYEIDFPEAGREVKERNPKFQYREGKQDIERLWKERNRYFEITDVGWILKEKYQTFEVAEVGRILKT